MLQQSDAHDKVQLLAYCDDTEDGCTALMYVLHRDTEAHSEQQKDSARERDMHKAEIEKRRQA